jgi:four helix bundle protein
MGNFQKLRVWQFAKEIAIKIYRLTRTKEFSKDYGLKDQIQRSAVSIPSNIAEGDELGSDKQSIRYFDISKGSVAELTTQLIIANEIGYIDIVTKIIFLMSVIRYQLCLPN